MTATDRCPGCACPRCGSTDPAVRNNMDPHFIHPDWCEDEWHDRPTGADPMSVREQALALAAACTDEQLVALRNIWHEEMEKRRG